MTSRDFVYWLQGYFEILNATSNRDTNEGALTSGQVDCIRNHLAMVFAHDIDPKMGNKEHQDLLGKLHAGSADSVKPTSQHSSTASMGPFFKC